MARRKYSDIERDIMKDVSNNLRRILKQKRIMQVELSEKTGLPTSTVSDLVNGRTLISPGNLQNIADALGVQKSEIDSSLSMKPAVVSLPTIPLIGTICAGNGLLAEQNIEDYIHYPFPSKRQPDYALRVKGNSMFGEGIEDGDVVYIRSAPWAEYNGQIVAAVIDNEGMLKRVKWSEGSPTILLIPENDEYETKEVYPNQVHICGVYMGHFKPERG